MGSVRNSTPVRRPGTRVPDDVVLLCAVRGAVCEGLLLFRHFQPGLGALQVATGPLQILFSVAGGEVGFRTLPRFLSSSCINFFRTLGGLGQNGHFIRQHFCESPGYRKMVRVVFFAVSDLSDRKLGDQRSVSRKDAKIPVLAGNLHFLRHIPDNHLLRSDNLELESVSHTVVGHSSSVVGNTSQRRLWPTTDDQRLLLPYCLKLFCRFHHF